MTLPSSASKISPPKQAAASALLACRSLPGQKCVSSSRRAAAAAAAWPAWAAVRLNAGPPSGLVPLLPAGRVRDVQIAVPAQVGQGCRRPGVAGVGDGQARRGQAHARVGHVVRQQHAVQPERARGLRRGRNRMPVEDLADRGAVPVLQLGQPGDDPVRGEQRDLGRARPAHPPGPHQRVQVDHVVGVVVADDDRVEPVRLGRAERGEQPGRGAVAQVDRDPRAVVLQQEPGTGPVRLRPRAAAAEHGQLAVHLRAPSGPKDCPAAGALLPECCRGRAPAGSDSACR